MEFKKTFKSKGSTKRKSQFGGKSVKRRKKVHYQNQTSLNRSGFKHDVQTLENECINKQTISTKDETITTYKLIDSIKSTENNLDIYKTVKHTQELQLDQRIPLTIDLDKGIELSNFKIKYNLKHNDISFMKTDLERDDRSYFIPGVKDQFITIDFGREIDILSMFIRPPVPRTSKLYKIWTSRNDDDIYTLGSDKYTENKDYALSDFINVRFNWGVYKKHGESIPKYTIKYRKTHGQWYSLGIFNGTNGLKTIPMNTRCKYIKIIPTFVPKQNEDLRITVSKKQSDQSNNYTFKTVTIKTKHDNYNPKYEIRS